MQINLEVPMNDLYADALLDAQDTLSLTDVAAQLLFNASGYRITNLIQYIEIYCDNIFKMRPISIPIVFNDIDERYENSCWRNCNNTIDALKPQLKSALDFISTIPIKLNNNVLNNFTKEYDECITSTRATLCYNFIINVLSRMNQELTCNKVLDILVVEDIIAPSIMRCGLFGYKSTAFLLISAADYVKYKQDPQHLFDIAKINFSKYSFNIKTLSSKTIMQYYIHDNNAQFIDKEFLIQFILKNNVFISKDFLKYAKKEITCSGTV